jgi:hypothetical protein
MAGMKLVRWAGRVRGRVEVEGRGLDVMVTTWGNMIKGEEGNAAKEDEE